MKAILVIDIPDEANIKDLDDYIVKNITLKNIKSDLGISTEIKLKENTRLKPMPEEMKKGFTKDFMLGWNSCREVIIEGWTQEYEHTN